MSSIISGTSSALKNGVSQLSRFTPTLSTIARSASASASASATPAPTFQLPTLSYQYHELEPAISGQIMETHHSKHHQAYVNNLNNALAQYAEAQVKNDVAAMIRLQPAIRFNGGGHLNHSIFWTNLAPPKQGGGVPPTGALLEQINRDFGSFDRLKTLLQTASVGIQGSGWGWLAYNPQYCRLEVITRANQDPMVELVPLLGIDVWEHAYYYLYGPNRINYLNAIWTVVNWKNVAERYAAAVAASAANTK